MSRATKNTSDNSLPTSGGGIFVSSLASVTVATDCSKSPHSILQTVQRPSTHSPGHSQPPGLVWPPSADTVKHRHSSAPAITNLLRFITQTSIESEATARHLTRLADFAYHARQFDALQVIADALKGIPGCAGLSAYYRGLSVMRLGEGNLEQAETLFTIAAGRAPLAYRSRALFELGAVAEYRKDYKSELELYADALKHGPDAFTLIETHRALAIAQSRASDHRRALDYLLSLRPLVEHCRQPRLYFDWLNSVAVELGALGQVEQAIRLSSLVLASPFAGVCPEYAETRRELEEREPQARALQVAAPQPQGEGEQQPDNQDPWPSPRPLTPDPWPLPTAYCILITHHIIERVYLCAPIHAPPAILS